MISYRRRLTLLEKISGSKGVPITALVARGDVASRHFQEKFVDFLRPSLTELETMLAKLTHGSVPDVFWKNLYAVVLDIQGSSGLAGYVNVNSIGVSLQRLLEERDLEDSRMVAAIWSHLYALNFAISNGVHDEAHLRVLLSELSRVVDRLPLKVNDFKNL